MKDIYRKYISIIISCAFIMGLLPTPAAAAEETCVLADCGAVAAVSADEVLTADEVLQADEVSPVEEVLPADEMLSSEGYTAVELPEGGTFQEGWYGFSEEELEQIEAEADALGTTEETSYDASEVRVYLYEQMKARNGRISLSDFTVPASDMEALVNATINASPDLYAVRSRYCLADDQGMAVALIVKYDETMDDALFDYSVQLALSEITGDMTQVEKAIVLHDYLAANCDYADKADPDGGYTTRQHSAYGVMVDRRAVCSGYAAAYVYLCKKVGVKCMYVSSGPMNHAWNMVILDGEAYHVDCTWDSSCFGAARHEYMFLSDDGFPSGGTDESGIYHSYNHYGWGVYEVGLRTSDYYTPDSDYYYGQFTASGHVQVGINATDDRYENAFFDGSTAPLKIYGNYIYFDRHLRYSAGYWDPALLSISRIPRGEFSLDNAETVFSPSESILANSFYDTGLFINNERIYFNNASEIFSIPLFGESYRTEFTKDSSDNNIFYCNYYNDAAEYSTDRGQAVPVALSSLYKGVRSIKLDADRLILGAGGSRSLWLSLYPSSYSISQCSLSMSDESVAKVSSYSADNNLINISALKEGTTVLTVSCGSKSATCTITVLPGLPWYESFDYELNETDKTITLTKYIGLDTEVTVSSDAVISGETYSVCMSSAYNEGFMNTGVVSVEFAEGVKLLSGQDLFNGCRNLSKVDMTGVDTSSVTKMQRMFYECSALKKLDLSGFDTGNVKEAYNMFWECSTLEYLDLGSFDMSNVTDCDNMLSDCLSLKNLTTPAKTVADMTIELPFYMCPQGEGADGEDLYDKLFAAPSGTVLIPSLMNDYIMNVNATQKTVTLMGYTGSDKQVTVPVSKNINSEKYVVNIGSYLFDGNDRIESAVFADGLKITSSLSCLFRNCTSLKRVDMSGVDSAGLSSFTYAFKGCRCLETLDMSGMDLSRLTSATGLLSDCSRLVELETPVNVPDGTDISLPFLMSDEKGGMYSVMPHNESVSHTLIRPHFGSCGEKAYWSWDGGTLTISGNGAISDNSSPELLPWGGHRSDTDSIVIGSGITRIGNYAFYESSPGTITLPDTISSLGYYSFYNCQNLRDVYFDGSKPKWDKVTAVQNGSLPGNVVVHFGKAGISFDSGCGSVDIMDVIPGNKVERPVNPVRPYHIFAGWFDDEECTKEHDFSKPVYKDITVYARWELGAAGSISDNICWQLDRDGILTVSGNGSLGFDSYSDQPWADFREEIKGIVIEDGITSLSMYSFGMCKDVEWISIPESVTSIYYAFCYGASVGKVYYDGCEEDWKRIYKYDTTGCGVTSAQIIYKKAGGKDISSSSEKEMETGSSSDQGKDTGSSSEQEKETSSSSDIEKEAGSSSEHGKETGSSSEHEKETGSSSEQEKDISSSSEQEKETVSSSEQEKETGSSSEQEKDTGSSSEQEKDISSSSEQEKDTGSSSEHEKDTGSSSEHEKDTGSSSEQDKDDSSSSEQEKDISSSSVREKDAGSSSDSKKAAPTRAELAVQAASEGRASIEDTVALTGSGKEHYISGTPPGDGREAVVTLLRGSKIRISNGMPGTFLSENKKLVSVSSRGIIKAKKATAGTVISYVNAGGKKVSLTVRVTELIGTSTGVSIKNTTAKTASGESFDMTTGIPLSVQPEVAAPGNTVRKLSCVIDERDGRYHITGTAVTKGTATVAFSYAGKKWKIKIKVV